MIARFCPGNQLADTVMKALAQAVPRQGLGRHRQSARSSPSPGIKDGTQWVHMEIFEGSYGGRYGIDGMDAVDTLYANTRNNPIEDIESHLPLRVAATNCARTSPAPASGAAASARSASSPSSPTAAPRSRAKATYRPWGFFGGSDGMPAEFDLVHGAAARRALPSKVPHMKIGKDGRFICYGPAGGGYGDPLERDPANVADDVSTS